MGRGKRRRPEKLGTKLLAIRKALGLSQNGMLRALGLEERFYRTAISEYETSAREPDLIALLCYARLAGVLMEVLVDDNFDLPDELPSDHS